MNEKKHILVTNDDGVMAPGLLALTQEMRKIAEVSILAPDRNWSGSGHVKTLDRPLRIRDVVLADGTPALASDGAPPIAWPWPCSDILKKRLTWWYPVSTRWPTSVMM